MPVIYFQKFLKFLTKWNGNKYWQQNFHKIIVKNKSNKKKIITYHFLVKSKPHERIDLLITTSENIYQTKKSNSKDNMLFLRKRDETIWKPPSF